MEFSGSAGASLATIATIRLDHNADYILVRVASAGAALTDFALQVCAGSEDYAASKWLTKYSSTDWESGGVIGADEWSGKDASGNYVNALADGGELLLKLNVSCWYAARFQAKGSGATVTISGGVRSAAR